ncbi:hypothetical protein P879_02658 [Paragonimus westermani]|uniref:Amine oxidase domain-containing protein n=1 Tax=Paragonimus westermani TaxID=34504 RepID=A0A8T0DR84_9TREM|nr:hypothetical protein P879_02658 [Paragonimus westermani]
MPTPTIYDVVVLGAGISGLTAAKILRKEGLKVVVLEARERNGGRIHSIRLPRPSDKTVEDVVDLGASYLHGCINSQDIQPLFALAGRLKMSTVTAPGDVLGPHRGWECPEIGVWRDHKTGREIGLKEVAEMSFLLDRCLVHILITGRIRKCAPNDNSTLADVLHTSLDTCVRLLWQTGQRASPTLTRREQGIFESLFARYIAYVNPATRLPLRLSLGAHYEADAAANLAYDASQPTPLAKQLYLDWLERKRAYLAIHGARPTVARRTEHKWEDRLVLQGFDQMIKFLATDLDIRHCRVVRHIDWSNTCPSTKSNTILSSVSSPTSASRPSEDHTGLICIETSLCSQEDHSGCAKHTPERYLTRYCIVTVPIGVLKGLDPRSEITFHPSLPIRKRLAIDRLGIPRFGAETHNKVVLQFRSADIFWDRNAAQLVCPGARLHILNCDYFGQVGILVAHIWGGSKLQPFNRPDEVVVRELLDILSGMYPDRAPIPDPVFTTVTRWSEDPFSLGAYTAGEVGSDDADRHAYAGSLPSAGNPRLLFAGEGTVDSSGGQQCTHGAFASGVSRALEVLDHMQGFRCRLRDIRIVDYLTGYRTYSHSPHTMLRRGMKRKPDSDTLRVDSFFPTVRASPNPAISETAKSINKDQTSATTVSENFGGAISDASELVQRRSNRLSTWISTQASASLCSTYKKRDLKTTYSASNSTSSLSSFRDDLTPSGSPQEPSDSAGEDELRTSGKKHTRQAIYQRTKSSTCYFGAPPRFQSPLAVNQSLDDCQTVFGVKSVIDVNKHGSTVAGSTTDISITSAYLTASPHSPFDSPDFAVPVGELENSRACGSPICNPRNNSSKSVGTLNT